jgi:hypothetical protein
MTSIGTELAALFTRDLARLLRQLDALDDARLWQVAPGVTNAAGNLMLHLSGNLREFVGRQLGGVPYVRNRPHEFAARDVERSALKAELVELAAIIPGVITRMPAARWDDTFPENVLGEPLDTGGQALRWYLVWIEGFAAGQEAVKISELFLYR